MPTPLLNRYPDDPLKPRAPVLERWHTALVLAVNSTFDSLTTLTAQVVANTASIVTNAANIALNTAAIALLQPVYGTWTPIDASGAGLTLTTPLFGSLNTYTKTNRIVVVNYSFTYPATADVSTARIGGLPFTADNAYFIGTLTNSNGGAVLAQVNANQAHFDPILPSGTAVATNANLSLASLYGSVTYRAAA